MGTEEVGGPSSDLAKQVGGLKPETEEVKLVVPCNAYRNKNTEVILEIRYLSTKFA